MNRGEANPRAKLTREAVEWIREHSGRYPTDEDVAFEVQMRFGIRVSRPTIAAVRKRVAWHPEAAS